jgi:hydrogenase maturation protease
VISANQNAAVIGLGNVFLGDDGFGPLVIETFGCKYACDTCVEVLDLGTPGLDLAPYLYDRHLVIMVDAVHADVAPGTLTVFSEADFVSRRAKLRITGHDPGLWESLAHLRLAGHAPAELIILGVSPESCTFADGISQGVLQIAANAADNIAQLLLDHGFACRRRSIPAIPNLWWLPIVPELATVSS